MINEFKQTSGIQIISIDLKFLNHKDANKYIELVTGHSIQKLCRNQRPKFYAKINGMLKEVPKFAFQNEIKLLDTIMGSFVVEEIE